MFDDVLPAGWVNARLGNYLFLKNGFAFKSTDYVDKTEGSFPIIRISNIDGKLASDESAVHIKSVNIANGFEIENGDLLIAMSGATTGKVGVYQGNEPAYQNQRVGNLKLLVDGLGSKGFRNHLVAFLSPDILKIAYGGAQPNISGSAIEDIEVNLPPLAEQHQIAAKLDVLLAQVDSIKTRLDVIPKILKRFRQSVLAAAVSGKLTEDWRVESNYFEPPQLIDWKWSKTPSSWKVLYYPELVCSRLGKMLDKAKNSGVPTKYLGNINVRWFEFDLTNTQEILVSEKEQIELSLKVGDVLICEGGEPGRCAVWKTDNKEPIIFQKALHKANVGEKIIPEWLVFNLKNDCDNKSIEQLFTGTTIKHLTGKALMKYPLRIPPIDEQNEIVRRVEQLFTYADQIEQRVKDAQARVNHLTQAILAKAFRGELTADWRAQNPDLISGENSAEALLSKINAEQKTQKLRGKKCS